MFTPTPNHPQPKSSRRAKSGPGPGEFFITDGRQAAGTIKQSGDSCWVAITPTGEQIGPFPNMVEAARALPRILESEVSA